jgi:WD40 repeat protein
MNKCPITISLATQTVHYQANGTPCIFEVQVRNDSDRQAQFQLDITAAGARSNADWYRLDPEVSVAKPPGDVTLFQVCITHSPIPNFSGLINLMINVLSPQLSEQARARVNLIVNADDEVVPVSLNLLPSHVQAYPRNPVDLMVQVRNLGYQPIDILLRLSGLTSSWLSSGAERRVLLNPQSDECIVFPCQPPSVAQARSQAYSFQIEAFSRSLPAGNVSGILEILPIGFIKFGVVPLQQSVPLQGWLPDWKTQTTTFWSELENLSNVAQQVNVDVQGQGAGKWWTYLPPADAELGLGATVKLPLEIHTHRPWVGLPQHLPVQMTARLDSGSENGSVDVDPDRQSVQLIIHPMIPVWLILALAALLITLLFFLLRPNPLGHTDSVNAVRFSDDLSLVSGADDCTIRRWRVNGDRLSPEGSLATQPEQNDCKPFQSKGVLAFTNKPVRALAFSPRMNDRVAAGLNNGVIQIWHLLTQKKLEELPDDGTGDRVFDLAFTPDAQRLLSGHGSGRIRVWQRQGEAFLTAPLQILKLSPERNYSIHALAISTDGRYLVSAGSKNTLVVWDMQALEKPATLLMAQKGEDSRIWDVDFKPESHAFVTADSDGNLKLWDLDQCGINTAFVDPSIDSSVDPSKPEAETPAEREMNPNCEPGDRWQASKAPIRTVRYSPDGKQLISAGDDGQVKRWILNAPGESLVPEVVFTSRSKINAVDLIETEQSLLWVSGDDHQRVNLQRMSHEKRGDQ